MRDNGPVAEGRIASLDFIRGIAVMGILAANIAAFGHPYLAAVYPGAFLSAHGPLSDQLWLAQFVIIDGKMRGLFTLLFGAGMVLFYQRACAKARSHSNPETSGDSSEESDEDSSGDAKSEDNPNSTTNWAGEALLLRRLFWLLIFGLIHFYLIWIGDILALYAMCGMLTILCLRWSINAQIWTGVATYVVGSILMLASLGPLPFIADATPTSTQTSAAGPAGFVNAEMQEDLELGKQAELDDAAEETALITQGDYTGLAKHMLSAHRFDPFIGIFIGLVETVPLILIGMGLLRAGLFNGGLNRRKQALWGWIGLLLGALSSFAIGAWTLQGGITYYGAIAAVMAFSTLPKLAMILGMAALLALLGNSERAGPFMQRISAAGRMAFSNYLGTSILMVTVFYGWGFGLYGQLERPALYLVTLAVWAIMLLWSKPWLDHFRYGPLEWLWRCLTYWRMLPIKK